MGSEPNPRLPESTGILVVGAGMAGLTAARLAAAAGRDVLVVDKGWNPGGRMATRRMGEASFDHGATFFIAGEARFTDSLDKWREAGFAGAWDDLETGVAHWRGLPDMRGLAGHLARGCDVRTRVRLASVARQGDRWVARTAEGASVTAEAVLMTPPVPQSLELLEAGGTQLAPRLRQRLGQVEYQRCLVVLAVLEGPAAVPAPGLLEPGDGVIARLVDERAKGTSPVSAVTIHARAEFSRERWDDDRHEVGTELLAAAGPWLGSKVKEYQVHGWKYARPVSAWPEPCLVAAEGPTLVLAGDAFGGPDLWGAHLSGQAAAEALCRPDAD